MEWISDLAELASSSYFKLTITVFGAAVPLIGLGIAISKIFGKENSKSLYRKNRFLEEQVEQQKDNLRSLQKNNQQLHDQIDVKNRELETFKAEIASINAKLSEAKRKLIPYYHSYAKLKPEYDRLKQELASEQEIIKALKHSANETDSKNLDLIEELQKRQSELDKTSRRVSRALRLEGTLWSVKALQKVPKFRSIQDRRNAIISVLNLKGGVGKTTVTSHLGMALARLGYKVLVVDLDLQGSLTQVFLPLVRQKAASNDGKLLQHFFSSASIDQTTKLTGYIGRID